MYSVNTTLCTYVRDLLAKQMPPSGLKKPYNRPSIYLSCRSYETREGAETMFLYSISSHPKLEVMIHTGYVPLQHKVRRFTAMSEGSSGDANRDWFEIPLQGK